MAVAVYLAYPIDSLQPGDSENLAHALQIIKNHMIREEGLMFFDPGRAWSATDCSPDPRVQAVNNAALIRSDAVVAILPTAVASVGVPMEMAWAVSAGIPVHVIRDGFSWALQVQGVTQYDSMALLLDAISHLEPLKRKPAPVVKYVPDETIDGDLDPRPQRGYPDDAGFDLTYYGQYDLRIPPDQSINVPSGLHIEWPPNTWGLVIGRSSTFHKKGMLVNTAVIDPGYRGPMFVSVRSADGHEHVISPGDRIAQIIPLPALAPKMDLQQVDELSVTERGHKGFGSSGK